MSIVCWNCGASLDDIPRPISRHATCSHCFNELHCCRLCKHYDPKRTMQCFEDRADPPLQKENANFCDFFAPQPMAYESKSTTRSDSARSKLDELFGAEADEGDLPSEAEVDVPEESSPEEDARKKLDDLFS